VCKTEDFGVNWTGIKHPIAPGPASDYVVTQSAFDNNGTLYVLHGNKLYVSYNQGEKMAFVHTLPRWGNAGRSDSGADQFFVVDSGTIHIGLLEDAGEGNARVYYLRGTGVDTANPVWDEELVDFVGNVRLDFAQIVLNGNGIPTISYTTPDKEVTTASRNAPLPTAPGRLLNISTRARVETGDNVLIGGFIVTGTAPRKVIVRGIGPSLRANDAPVPDRLADPTLELYAQGNPVPLAANDDWKTNQVEIETTGLAPSDDAESAIVRTLEPGAYTAVLRGKDQSTGVALVEAYDLENNSASTLANLSTRGFVQTGDNVMIGGFICGPNSAGAITVVARGIGPSLKDRVPTAIDDPTLELHDANGALIESNDDWSQSPAAAEIQTVGLAPANGAESALLIPALSPGAYTAIVRGKGESSGIGLVEIYHLR
jgi:hypothetical protein